MHMLMFEVTPFPDRRNEYLDIAARLKPELERSGGCRFIERFQHSTAAEHLLSFQLWDDEAAITAWRTNLAHHDVQLYSRENVFEDYRLRVAEVVQGWHADSALLARVTEAASAGRLVVAQQSGQPLLPLAQHDALDVVGYTSLYRADQYLHLLQPQPDQFDAIGKLATATPDSCHVAIVTRDYGMFERDEAPQVCPVARRT